MNAGPAAASVVLQRDKKTGGQGEHSPCQQYRKVNEFNHNEKLCEGSDHVLGTTYCLSMPFLLSSGVTLLCYIRLSLLNMLPQF